MKMMPIRVSVSDEIYTKPTPGAELFANELTKLCNKHKIWIVPYSGQDDDAYMELYSFSKDQSVQYEANSYDELCGYLVE